MLFSTSIIFWGWHVIISTILSGKKCKDGHGKRKTKRNQPTRSLPIELKNVSKWTIRIVRHRKPTSLFGAKCFRRCYYRYEWAKGRILLPKGRQMKIWHIQKIDIGYNYMFKPDLLTLFIFLCCWIGIGRSGSLLGTIPCWKWYHCCTDISGNHQLNST